MYVIKIIRMYYLLLTLFVILVINSTTLSFIDVVPAVILMWLCFLMFFIGYRNKKEKSNESISERYSGTLLLGRRKLYIAVIAIVSAIEAVRFYTGQTIAGVINNLIAGNSLYIMYQEYFAKNELWKFSLGKIPYSLMLFFLTFCIIYSYVSIAVLKEKTTLWEKIYLVVVSIGFLYVGTGRGTNFELFEFLILIVYAIISRLRYRKNTTSKNNIRNLVILALLGIGSLMLFSYVIFRRGNIGIYISNEIRYDPRGLFSQVAPSLSLLVSVLTGYFGFGFFYISTLISKIWLVSTQNFFGFFLPLGLRFFGETNVHEIMKGLIDMSVLWTPDAAFFISTFGFIGVLVICFILGFILKYINHQEFLNDESIIEITGFMIMFQMVSLPVGNFVLISSANKMTCLLLAGVWAWNYLKRFIIKK